MISGVANCSYREGVLEKGKENTKRKGVGREREEMRGCEG